MSSSEVSMEGSGYTGPIRKAMLESYLLGRLICRRGRVGESQQKRGFSFQQELARTKNSTVKMLLQRL